jgi:hypothetical protein
MVSNDQNSYGVTNNTKQKVVREAVEIDAANVAPANGERLRPLCGLEHETP